MWVDLALFFSLSEPCSPLQQSLLSFSFLSQTLLSFSKSAANFTILLISFPSSPQFLNLCSKLYYPSHFFPKLSSVPQSLQQTLLSFSFLSQTLLSSSISAANFAILLISFPNSPQFLNLCSKLYYPSHFFPKLLLSSSISAANFAILLISFPNSPQFLNLCSKLCYPSHFFPKLSSVPQSLQQTLLSFSFLSQTLLSSSISAANFAVLLISFPNSPQFLNLCSKLCYHSHFFPKLSSVSQSLQQTLLSFSFLSQTLLSSSISAANFAVLLISFPNSPQFLNLCSKLYYPSHFFPKLSSVPQSLQQTLLSFSFLSQTLLSSSISAANFTILLISFPNSPQFLNLCSKLCYPSHFFPKLSSIPQSLQLTLLSFSFLSKAFPQFLNLCSKLCYPSHFFPKLLLSSSISAANFTILLISFPSFSSVPQSLQQTLLSFSFLSKASPQFLNLCSKLCCPSHFFPKLLLSSSISAARFAFSLSFLASIIFLHSWQCN